jgi:hypothetical protein
LCIRSIEPQQQPVIKLGRIIDAVFIENERVHQGADLQQAMPVGAVACQPRYFQSQDDPRLTQAHLGHQFLEALAIHRRGAGLAQIAVDHDDLLDGPAQCHCLLAESILALGALLVLEDLTDRGLPNIQVSVALQMAGVHFLMSIGSH